MLAHSNDKQFTVMDINKDGMVAAEEHVAGARKTFKTMDSNKDGKVTAAEMNAADQTVTGRKAAKSHMSAVDKIKMIDKDGDGIISADEHAVGSAEMFTKMDADKDGFLSKAESMAGHASMMKKPAQH